MSAKVLSMITRVKPGSFLDARLSHDPENAIVYRTRQPLIDKDTIEVPMLQDFGIFRVSAIMSGRTQVGICVRFSDKIDAKVTQGDHATFKLKKLKDNELGVAKTSMKTSDFLIFELSSRGALVLKKLTKGRGYGTA